MKPLELARRACLKLRDKFEEDYRNVSLSVVNEHFTVALHALSELDGQEDFLKAVHLTTEAREKARWLVCRLQPHIEPQVARSYLLIEIDNEIKTHEAMLAALKKQRERLEQELDQGIRPSSRKVVRNAINKHTYWDSRIRVASESNTVGG